LESKNDMPKISYLTAIDYYIIFCFIFLIFSTFEVVILSSSPVANHQKNIKKMAKKLRKNKKFNFFYKNKMSIKMKKKYKILLKKKPDFNLAYNQWRRVNANNSVAFRLSSPLTRKNFIETSESNKRHYKLDRFEILEYYAKILYPFFFISFNVIYFVFYLNQREKLINH
jgi:hypothetical protein